jgi:hypothetical protein
MLILNAAKELHMDVQVAITPERCLKNVGRCKAWRSNIALKRFAFASTTITQHNPESSCRHRHSSETSQLHLPHTIIRGTLNYNLEAIVSIPIFDSSMNAQWPQVLGVCYWR